MSNFLRIVMLLTSTASLVDNANCLSRSQMRECTERGSIVRELGAGILGKASSGKFVYRNNIACVNNFFTFGFDYGADYDSLSEKEKQERLAKVTAKIVEFQREMAIYEGWFAVEEGGEKTGENWYVANEVYNKVEKLLEEGKEGENNIIFYFAVKSRDMSNLQADELVWCKFRLGDYCDWGDDDINDITFDVYGRIAMLEPGKFPIKFFPPADETKEERIKRWNEAASRKHLKLQLQLETRPMYDYEKFELENKRYYGTDIIFRKEKGPDKYTHWDDKIGLLAFWNLPRSPYEKDSVLSWKEDFDRMFQILTVQCGYNIRDSFLRMFIESGGDAKDLKQLIQRRKKYMKKFSYTPQMYEVKSEHYMTNKQKFLTAFYAFYAAESELSGIYCTYFAFLDNFRQKDIMTLLKGDVEMDKRVGRNKAVTELRKLENWFQRSKNIAEGIEGRCKKIEAAVEKVADEGVAAKQKAAQEAFAKACKEEDAAKEAFYKAAEIDRETAREVLQKASSARKTAAINVANERRAAEAIIKKNIKKTIPENELNLLCLDAYIAGAYNTFKELPEKIWKIRYLDNDYIDSKRNPSRGVYNKIFAGSPVEVCHYYNEGVHLDEIYYPELEKSFNEKIKSINISIPDAFIPESNGWVYSLENLRRSNGTFNYSWKLKIGTEENLPANVFAVVKRQVGGEFKMDEFYFNGSDEKKQQEKEKCLIDSLKKLTISPQEQQDIDTMIHLYYQMYGCFRTAILRTYIELGGSREDLKSLKQSLKSDLDVWVGDFSISFSDYLTNAQRYIVLKWGEKLSDQIPYYYWLDFAFCANAKTKCSFKQNDINYFLSNDMNKLGELISEKDLLLSYEEISDCKYAKLSELKWISQLKLQARYLDSKRDFKRNSIQKAFQNNQCYIDFINKEGSCWKSLEDRKIYIMRSVNHDYSDWPSAFD